jgi:TatD family-associated radical SAM protein
MTATTPELTYRFETPAYPGNILYVKAVTQYQCTNDCLFCSRPRNGVQDKENIYERKAGTSLYIAKTPTIDEVMKSIDQNIKDDDEELVLIGLGEPLINLNLVLGVIKRTKAKYEIRTRVDTDGVLNGKYDNLAERLEKTGLDRINISLNAINEREYNALCQPKLKESYQNLLDFIRDCNASPIDTFVSFVVDFVDENTGIKTRPKEEYIEFAKSLEIEEDHVIIRPFIQPVE